MANQITDVSKLDFVNIRNELKEYLSSQDQFTDYDFDGAGISVLLDLLAHNTHYNALLAHMNMNETFLETSQVRANVVSHAQLIGYVPKSRAASSTMIDVTVQGDINSSSSLTIPRGSKFTGTINNTEFTFVSLESFTAVKLNDNSYQFFSIPVYEGQIKTEKFRADGVIDFQRYELLSGTLDTNTISVSVYANANSAEYEEYTYYNNITDVEFDSPVFFVRENPFGNYEIYFGDDFIGKKPTSGSLVVVEYVETNGPSANNIISLSSSQSFDGLSNVTVSFSGDLTKTTGGTEKETIDSIQYNAPVNYAIQDRAVTANDYKILLTNNFPEIRDVSVWGGEDADPPEYGKVFIAPSLESGELVTETFSDTLEQFLKTKNVGAITPEIVNAEYNYIEAICQFKYSAKNTTKRQSELETIVKNTIFAYAERELGKFDGILRVSRLLSEVDNSDPGIESSVFGSRIYKIISPNPLIASDYEILYPCRIEESIAADENIIESDLFTIEGVQSKILDEPMNDGTKNRRLFIVNAATGDKLTRFTDIGYAEVSTGKIFINSIKFDTSNTFRLYVKPNSFDLAPKYNQILRVELGDILVTGDLDTVAEYRLAGLSNYQTFERD